MSLFLQLKLDYVSAFLPWSRDLSLSWSQATWWPKLHPRGVYHTTALRQSLDYAQCSCAPRCFVQWQLKWWWRRWSIQVKTAKRWRRRPCQGCDRPTTWCGWRWRMDVERGSNLITGFSWSRRRRNRRTPLEEAGLVGSAALCLLQALAAAPRWRRQFPEAGGKVVGREAVVGKGNGDSRRDWHTHRPPKFFKIEDLDEHCFHFESRYLNLEF